MHRCTCTDHDSWGSTREQEAIRRVLRKELRSIGQRSLADDIGIGRGALRKFLSMSLPEADTLAKLRGWYADRPEPQVPEGSVALAVLAREFPAPRRPWARRSLAQRLSELLVKVGVRAPAWLQEELSST